MSKKAQVDIENSADESIIDDKKIVSDINCNLIS